MKWQVGLAAWRRVVKSHVAVKWCEAHGEVVCADTKGHCLAESKLTSKELSSMDTGVFTEWMNIQKVEGVQEWRQGDGVSGVHQCAGR